MLVSVKVPPLDEQAHCKLLERAEAATKSEEVPSTNEVNVTLEIRVLPSIGLADTNAGRRLALAAAE